MKRSGVSRSHFLDWLNEGPGFEPTLTWQQFWVVYHSQLVNRLKAAPLQHLSDPEIGDVTHKYLSNTSDSPTISEQLHSNMFVWPWNWRFGPLATQIAAPQQCFLPCLSYSENDLKIQESMPCAKVCLYYIFPADTAVWGGGPQDAPPTGGACWENDQQGH